MSEVVSLLFVVGLAALVVYWRWREAAVVLPEAPDRSWLRRPAPGEIWWADVPFDDSWDSKVRPCLVIRTHRKSVEVLKITSQDKSHRWDHIEIETGSWDRRARYNSYLDLSSPRKLLDQDFKRRAGTCDEWTWNQVLNKYDAGWVVKRREAA